MKRVIWAALATAVVIYLGLFASVLIAFMVDARRADGGTTVSEPVVMALPSGSLAERYFAEDAGWADPDEPPARVAQ